MRVAGTETRTVDGHLVEYTVLVPTGREGGAPELRVCVPTAQLEGVAVRTPMTAADARRVVASLTDGPTDAASLPWSRAYRTQRDRVRTGEPDQLAELVRDLAPKAAQARLSVGEKRLYDQALQMLAGEVGLATGQSAEAVLATIRERAGG